MTPFQYLKISQIIWKLKLITLLDVFEHQNLEEIFISRVHFGVTGPSWLADEGWRSGEVDEGDYPVRKKESQKEAGVFGEMEECVLYSQFATMDACERRSKCAVVFLHIWDLSPSAVFGNSFCRQE